MRPALLRRNWTRKPSATAVLRPAWEQVAAPARRAAVVAVHLVAVVAAPVPRNALFLEEALSLMLVTGCSWVKSSVMSLEAVSAGRRQIGFQLTSYALSHAAQHLIENS